MSSVAVAVVSWNTREHLADCLQSVTDATAGIDAEIVVVDNASSDGSVAMVRHRFPAVRLIANDTNVGFARGNNQAIAATSAPVVLMLNSDARLRAAALRRLLARIESTPCAGLVGARLCDGDGSFQYSHARFPNLWQEALILTGLGRALHGPWYPSAGPTSDDRAHAVDWVGGACMCARRAALDAVGGLDEGYRLYGEEVDLCRALRNAGWEVWYEPEAVVVHHGGASAAQLGPQREAHLYRSRLRFFRKHRGGAAARGLAALIALITVPKIALHGALLRLSGGRLGRPTLSMASLRAALADPAAGVPGDSSPPGAGVPGAGVASATRAIVLLACVALLAMAVGNVPGMGYGRTAPLLAQLGGLAVFAASAAAFVAGTALLRTARALRRVTWICLAIGLAIAASRTIPVLGGLTTWLPCDASGLAAAWCAALGAGQALCNRALDWRLRLGLGLGAAWLGLSGLLDGRVALSGWLPPLVAAAAVVACAAPRLALAGGGVVALGAALWLAGAPRQLVVSGDPSSSASRTEAWRISAEMSAANPLLGLGPANPDAVAPLFARRGVALDAGAHSNFVDLVAETGLLGLACFLAFCWLVGREAWRVRRCGPTGFVRAHACGALGGLAGTLAAAGLGDAVLPSVDHGTLRGLSASLPGFLLLGAVVGVGYGVPGAPAPHTWLRRWRHLATPRHALPLIIALFIGLRLVAAIALGDNADPVSGAYDQRSYDALAQRVVAGYGFSFASPWYPFTAADTPTAHWSFLYTLYLAAVYALTGHHPLAARVLQALASGLIAWLTFRIGRRLFSARVGLTAAALSACYAYGIFFGAALMTQTFYTLALLAALERALAIVRRPTMVAWLLLGLALGAGALLRQTLLLFTPVLLVWLLGATRARPRWGGAAAALAAIALCILPWTVRNYVVFGDLLLLNSNGGYVLYASNHPERGVDFDPTFAPPLPDAVRGLPEPAADRALARAGFASITSDPWRFVRLSWSRLSDYYWLTPTPQACALANVARGMSFGLYAPLMLYGLLLSWRAWRACLPLYLYVGFDAALHLTSWAAPRYRLPSDAVLMVCAALALLDLAARARALLTHTGRRGFAVPADPVTDAVSSGR